MVMTAPQQQSFAEVAELFEDTLRTEWGTKTRQERLVSLEELYQDLRQMAPHENVMKMFHYIHWVFSWIIIPLIRPIQKIPVLGQVLGALVTAPILLIVTPFYGLGVWTVESIRKNKKDT